MKIFGIELRLAKAGEKALNAVPQRGFWHRIMEPFAGAWQRNISEEHGSLLQYPTLYACIMRIATDIGKLPFVLKENKNGIWDPVENPAYSPVLRKPNGYQTAQQFRESWLLSKLVQGNTYVLKGRDKRGVVNALYVLDPCRVLPMVSDTGNVFYKLQPDRLNKVSEDASELALTIPASEIIHDRCVTLYHWLIGVPPLSAAYWPALKNLKILKSAAEFFGNNSQPGGILTAPAGMTEDDSKLIKAYWDENYTGENVGKIAVIGADMKFTPFQMKGVDAQLIEQMKYSDEQVAQPFGIPPYKVGIGAIPAGMGVDGINQLYYSDALQSHIEHMEALMDEGLSVPTNLSAELDLEPLLRMDVGKQAEVMTKLTGGGIATPNEGRRNFGYAPLEGGDTVYMQQQDFPLDQVRKNKIAAADPAPAPIPPDPEPEEVPDEDAKDFVLRVEQQIQVDPVPLVNSKDVFARLQEAVF